MKLTTIKDAQQQVDEIIQEFGGYWPPLSMLASVVEEIGELSREINSLENFKPKKDSEVLVSIDEEISDVFFSLICLANHYNIDLAKGLKNVIQKYKKRDNNRF